MTFHRTPAEMAADVSYARSGVGESASRHMLWLTAADLAAIGDEPPTEPKIVDRTDPAAIEDAATKRRSWLAWWDAIGTASSRRRREALSDSAWHEEYVALLAERRAAGPAEMAAIVAEGEAFDALHPQRGLTDEEKTESAANWEERWRLCRQYNAAKKKDPKDPTLPGILEAMKACDARNDAFITLSWSRPTYEALQQAS